jgi:succinate dehydrogenase / fumarate reductase cytochrome b subunit
MTAPDRPSSVPAVGVAVSGLLLALFLVVHLAGLVPALVNPAAFERYAAVLHRQPWLPVVEAALLVALLFHPLLALRRAILLARARGTAPALRRSRREGPGDGLAALAAVQAPAIGGLLLAFLALHLLQLRWHRPAEGQELEALQSVLRSPASLLLYTAGSLAAGLHLFHGHEAAHRSLGLLDPVNGARIRAWGRLLALLLGGGFALLALLLRFSPA